MIDIEAFKATQKGLIKRESRYGSKIYMYPDRTGYVVSVTGSHREARPNELSGYGNWLPVEDGFMN